MYILYPGIRECKRHPIYVKPKTYEQLIEQVSAILSDFNQSIQEESKDRKYRASSSSGS